MIRTQEAPRRRSSESPTATRIAATCVSCTVAAAAFVWAAAVSLSGGFIVTILGIRISSHRIVPPFVVGLLFLLLTAEPRERVKRLGSITLSARVVAVLASLLAALVFVAAIRFGAFTAVGDAFGYLAQSALWLKGELFQSPGPVLAMMWRDAAFAFCPLGFRPGAIAGTMVPTYAPGLPLLMAALRGGFGETGAYLVVPLCGAAVVSLTFRLGRMWRDGATGLFAAVLIATSPVFLFQLVQPMSDVPVTAWWLLAIVAASDASWTGALGSGLAASVAILIRPNLAPLAAPLAVWVLLASRAQAWRGRIGRMVVFVAAVSPLCLLVTWVQSTLYGSAFASGYGRASDIYALKNLLPNLERYPAWLIQTHTPFVLLAALAPFVARRTASDSRQAALFAWLALVFAACVFLAYAFYIPFEHWSYLRFLLPALPLVVTLSAGTFTFLLRRHPWGAPAMAFSAALLVLLNVQAAVRGDVFGLRPAFEARYREVARFVSEQTPRNAAFIGIVQTSSVSYYAHRQTLRCDWIQPADLDRVVTDLRRAGYAPFLLLMREEEPYFRARFSGKSRVGDLRCAPRSTFSGGEVRLYDPGDCVAK